MFPLRSPPVHVASVGGGEGGPCLIGFCQTGQAVCIPVCVCVCVCVDRPRQTGEPNYCNPARGASEKVDG
jgi:hypothetical protein